MEIRLILDVGASDKWYGDHWIISYCPHCILGHSHLVRYFVIKTWLSVCDYCFRWIMELLTPWVRSSLHTRTISDTYIHFHFVLRRFTLDTFMLPILPEPDHFLLLSRTSHHDTWLHTPPSIRRRCRSILDHLGCAFIHLSDFRFNIFHDSRA